MPFGDSVTQGAAQHNSYRRPLWIKLKNGGYYVDFVGSQDSNFGGAPQHTDFDLTHEGHWGWRADELLYSVHDWASANQPDIVLLHVGTNDVLQGQSVNSTVNDISQIIDRLRAVNPNVKLLLAKLIPTTRSENGTISALNEALGGLAEQKNTRQSSLTIVDQNANFNAYADTYDGVHPNEGGEEKMAATWYQALQPLLAPAPSPNLLPAVNPSNTTAGLNYQYYEGSWRELPDFNMLAPEKEGSTAWPTLAPRNRDEHFAFRYTGYIDVPADGEYTFYTSSDDGSQLFIDSHLVVDNNGLHSLHERSGTIGLQRGKHALTVTFFESTGGQEFDVNYEGPGIGKSAIPAMSLYREGNTGSSTASFYRAINLNGPALQLDGNAWEASTTANFSYSGHTYENQDVALSPATDSDRAHMIRSMIWGGAVSLTLNAVPSGTYDVYLYVWEDNHPETFNIELENRRVMSDYNSEGQGRWNKLGPWRTTITDGALNLEAHGGAANLSGLEVWRIDSENGLRAAQASSNTDQLSVHPNPAVTQVFLTTDANNWSQAIIRDSYGQVRLSQKRQQVDTGLDISALPNGVYMVEATTADGHLLRSRLLIEH
ncbi:GDSL-type esterase/lipase family protein [Hymenobacter volaticus]|uniref:GDSL-type esterase/lipase family protein n=2 Tax=Hymenobacter volaticus TaxID=2932254 RepID=A0ABY4GBG7_9BACT|nr:GDSL-type esterase/lipase family protein [Hymenobacter volaticus]